VLTRRKAGTVDGGCAETLLKYTFSALLKEREEDLAFFDQRIEKGLVAKLEGIVGSEFWLMALQCGQTTWRDPRAARLPLLII
jgi:hypothetical protein